MFGDLAKIMKIAGEMKRKLPEMKARLAATQYTAQAGSSAVSATVNGSMALIDLKIDKAVLADGDVEMLQDLIKSAVAAAQAQASEAAAAAMKEITGGMDLPGIEGMF